MRSFPFLLCITLSLLGCSAKPTVVGDQQHAKYFERNGDQLVISSQDSLASLIGMREDQLLQQLGRSNFHFGLILNGEDLSSEKQHQKIILYTCDYRSLELVLRVNLHNGIVKDVRLMQKPENAWVTTGSSVGNVMETWDADYGVPPGSKAGVMSREIEAAKKSK